MIIIIIIIIIRWVHPDGGRKTYETKSPGSGEVLAATTQVVYLCQHPNIKHIAE